MTIQDLGSLGELIAAAATILTLVYLALQIRNSSRATRFDSHMKIRQLTAESQKILTDPDKARLWRVGLSDPDSLTEDERISFHCVLYLFVNARDAGLEYGRTTRDRDAYKTEGDFMELLANSPGFSRWWARARGNYNSDMIEHVESRIRASSTTES